jgi:hypothetical protein
LLPVADGDTDVLDFSSSTAAIKVDLGSTALQTVAIDVQLIIPTIAVEGVSGGSSSDRRLLTSGVGRVCLVFISTKLA